MRTPALLIGGVLFDAACASLVQSSRTGIVGEVVIGADLAPRDLEVAPGDEVRFVNRRSQPVWIAFPEYGVRRLACQRGLAFRSPAEHAARIDPEASVGLCFTRPDRVGFSVHVEPMVERGGMPAVMTLPASLTGAIIVQEPRLPRLPRLNGPGPQ